MNKILEEVGKTFGRQLMEAIVSHGAITLVQAVVTDTVDYYKNKKLIEISRAPAINDMVEVMQQDTCCQSCGCNSERYENESPVEYVEPEEEPQRGPKKSKKKSGKKSKKEN